MAVVGITKQKQSRMLARVVLNVKTATQATADKEFHDSAKKKPAMNEGRTCAQKAVGPAGFRPLLQRCLTV